MKNLKLMLVAAVAGLAFTHFATAQVTPPPAPPYIINPTGSGGLATATATPTATPTMTTSPTIGTWHHYVVNLGLLQAIGATTSGDVTLDTLPVNSVVVATLVKQSTPLVGGGPLSAATARVTSPNFTSTYGTAFDVFQAAGATVFDIDSTHPKMDSGALKLHMALTGGNASQLTAGQIDVWVAWAPLQ